jgi:hypothetical protein
MVERQVFVRLKPEYATERGRDELKARALELSGLPEVRGLTVGTPADEAARGAWDVSLTLRMDSLAAIERSLEHSIYVGFLHGFLETRAHVIKAWNFEV